jgi:hypothetical protein
MINLFLTRLFFKETYTIGKLELHNVCNCDTLEDKVRDLNKDGDLLDSGEGKIDKHTAIPFGRYPVTVTYSGKFRRKLPLILNVKHFTGIRIHRGNTAEDSSGCILVGENTAPGQLTNSTFYEKKITAMLSAYLEAGEQVFINVI